MIVENDLDIRYFVSGVLVLAGALVTATAARDTEHVALAADVIVCGLATAEAGGAGFVESLRRRHTRDDRQVPALALLPPGAGEDAARAAGFDHYLARPVDADDLLATVWALSRRR